MATIPSAFDVYLTGARDNSPSVQMRLAGSIAGRYRLSAPVVAEALEGSAPCRVASAVPRGEAQALVNALETLGAVARLTPAGTPLTAAPAAASPPAAAGAPIRSPAAVARTSVGGDEFLSPHPTKDGRITLKSAEIESPSVVDLSEPIDFAEVSPEGKTGVRGSDTTRCPIHGLVYNRRKASGCMRCLAAARVQARKLKEERTGGYAPPDEASGSGLRDNPVRRAFWGLAVALAVGFVPAATYARAVNHREVMELRAQQAAPPVSLTLEQAQVRFDELDTAVDRAHRRGASRTLMIWLAVGAVAGAAWTRLTRPV